MLVTYLCDARAGLFFGGQLLVGSCPGTNKQLVRLTYKPKETLYGRGP